MKYSRMKQFVFGILSMALLASCSSVNHSKLGDGLFAQIDTNKGEVYVQLYYKETPVTVANFVTLAEGSNPFVSEEFKEKKFYDGLTFHRVMKDFMIQGGDPTGTGMGNPGYRFKDEIVDTLKHSEKGILSMANGGPDSNGSQFFITHAPTPWLDGVHTVFGKVVEGLAVVDSIATVPVGEKNKPTSPVTMNSVKIIRNGKEAKNFDAVSVLTSYFKGEEERKAAQEALKKETAALFQAQKDTAITLDSGLKYVILRKGDGPKPVLGESALTHYAGFLEDGTLFDTSMEDVAKQHNNFNERKAQAGMYIPIPMKIDPATGLIPGFKEGLFLMSVGDKYRLFIPSHLGYGPQGSGPIPPNADLVFDLEVTGIQENME